MNYLIGDRGLIGKTLLKTEKFDHSFNSSNFSLFGNFVKKDEDNNVILSCLPATKWLINQNKFKDLQNIYDIANELNLYNFNQIILISTIDVYLDSPTGVDEAFEPTIKTLHYGSHRLLFEKIIRDLISYKRLYIFRLPALFGDFLKKNILYDLLHDNNLHAINKNTFYQWYNLNRLSYDMKYFTQNYPGGTFNFFPEPICTKDLIHSIFPNKNIGYEGDEIVYNWKTKYGVNGYTQTAEDVMQEITNFVNEFSNK